MSGGGGGTSIFAAFAIVKSLFRGKTSIDDIEQQAALDHEELREVEYEEMGLPLPKRLDEAATSRRFRGLRRGR
jgi:hypothetical protein